MKWKPIDTAPRDGRDVLIYGGTYDVACHERIPMSGVCIAYWYHDYWRGGDANAHDEWYRHTPTHWMPLPEPPQ